MPTQTLSTPYLRRPNLQHSDYLISQRHNEMRYVPSSLVPSEIEGNIYTDRLVLVFRYITAESALEKKFRRGNVELELGKYTKKILAISLSFKPKQSSLLAAIDEAVKTVRIAGGMLDRTSIQKSYSLIVDFLNHTKEDLNTPSMKRTLENQFRHKSS